MKSRIFFFLIVTVLFSSCATIKNVTYSVPERSVPFVSERSVPLEPEQNLVIRIVQISDLHSNDYGKNQHKLIEKILAAKPDVVFFTGDIFDFEWPEEKAVERVRLVVAAVSKVCPFFYISGNHEYYLGHNNEYAGLFTEYGGTVLENQTARITIKGLEFIVAGVSDPIMYVDQKARKSDAFDLPLYKAALETVALQSKESNGEIKILLAHRPEFIDLYKDSGVYDLILSGHAHGGQWRGPFINGLYAPGQGLFPKYAGGRYNFNNKEKPSVFIISRGLSYQKPLFPRFFNPVEIVEILVQTEAFRK